MQVFVYWNLHRKCWSVKALEGGHKGRVIAHCDKVRLVGCEFRVSEAGRQRVLREKKKNVHAGIVGRLMQAYGTCTRIVGGKLTDSDYWFEPGPDYLPVTYNPYRGPTFVSIHDDGSFIPPARECHIADEVVMNGRQVMARRPR